jgi:hypothetical protein
MVETAEKQKVEQEPIVIAGVKLMLIEGAVTALFENLLATVSCGSVPKTAFINAVVATLPENEQKELLAELFNIVGV